MSKMVPLHQIIEIEKVFRDVRVGGIVTKSNFLEEGQRHLFPIDDEIADKVEAGQKLRITFYSMDDEVEEEPGLLKFKSKGVKYELWNEDNEGWDRLLERMVPQDQ